MGSNFSPTTENGFDLFRVSSAMQKAIRRGQEREAMYWTVELSISGYEEYFWKRIAIIASEDVGFANPMLPILIDSLYNRFKINSKKQRGDGILFMTHATIACVRSPKSRMLDWAKCVYWENHENTKLDIPDEALDQHTRVGKQKGRGMVHFMEVGSVINDVADVPMEDQYRNEAYKILCDKYDVGRDVNKNPELYPGYVDFKENVEPTLDLNSPIEKLQLDLFPEMNLTKKEC